MDEHREARRFWTRVRLDESGCWLWTGGTRANGYGSFAIKSPTGSWTQTTAHRWAYGHQVAPVPADMEADHLCKVRNCVRPDHLEVVTVVENRRRRDVGYAPDVPRDLRPLPVIPDPPAPARRRNPETHCLNGHEYAVTGWVKNGANRTCAACRDAATVRKRKGGAHGTETHCPHGHPYSEENTYKRVRPDGSVGRECRTCVLRRNREAAHRRAASQ